MSPFGVAPANAKHWFWSAAPRSHAIWIRWMLKRCWRSSSLRSNA
jgi:hypothetical protein